MTNKTKGILLIIAAAFFFSLMNTFVKLSGDLPSIQKSFFRNFVAFFISLFLLIRSNEKLNFDKKNLPLLILRAICGTFGILCNFYAVDNLLLSDASMLSKLAPFFAILASFLILKEKVKPAQAFSILIAFVGSLFIIKPDIANFSASMPALIGATGAMFAGTAYTLVRRLGSKGERSSFIVFFFSSFSCLVTLPFLVLNYHPMTLLQLSFLIMAGISASIGQFAITNAYMLAPAREISVFDYTQVIFAAITGFILFEQFPDNYSFIGYGIICSVAIFTFFKNKPETEALSNGSNHIL